MISENSGDSDSRRIRRIRLSDYLIFLIIRNSEYSEFSKTMFKSARVKLTAWYLLIIMTISLSFSGVIYRVETLELDRVERAQRLRIERGLPERFRVIPFNQQDDLPNFFRLDPALIEETKSRLVLFLVMINSVILVTSALAGYFLAGRTLEPIENSLEEQKRFVADASHELRTPLTALKTSLEVALRDKKMTLTDAKKVLDDNLEEVENLKSLSDKLLSLARYQSNGHSLSFKEVNIKEVVEKAIKKITPLAKEKEIGLESKVAFRRNSSMQASQKLMGNEESLEEMLLIFLDNGVKYTPKGGKVAVETLVSGKWLVVRVKDTGIGIAKDELPHIFDRFYRAEQSRSKEKVSGFGLGLSLAKKIIEIHKGTVEVESVLGKGTSFTIKLPLKQ